MRRNLGGCISMAGQCSVCLQEGLEMQLVTLSVADLVELV